MTSLSDLDERSSILSAEVGWSPPTGAEAAVDRGRASRVGAVVAVATCLAIAMAGWLLVPMGWVLGIAGLPATTFLAWRMGHRVVTDESSSAVWTAFLLGVETILVSDALVAIVLTCAALASLVASGITMGLGDPVTSIGGAFAFGLEAFGLGALFVGIPVAFVVVPAALVWAGVVRALAGRDWSR